MTAVDICWGCRIHQKDASVGLIHSVPPKNFIHVFIHPPFNQSECVHCRTTVGADVSAKNHGLCPVIPLLPLANSITKWAQNWTRATGLGSVSVLAFVWIKQGFTGIPSSDGRRFLCASIQPSLANTQVHIECITSHAEYGEGVSSVQVENWHAYTGSVSQFPLRIDKSTAEHFPVVPNNINQPSPGLWTNPHRPVETSSIPAVLLFW